MTALLLLAALRAGQVELLEESPYSFDNTLRAFIGAGSTAETSQEYGTFTLELGSRVFGGGFAAGVSGTLSSNASGSRKWWLASGGIYIELDLTYLALSGLWSTAPPKSFPIRVQVSSRIGIDYSRSWYPDGVFDSTPYALLRPAIQSSVMLAWPVWRGRSVVLFLRGTLDTPISMSSVFRGDASAGVACEWGR